MSNIEHVRDCPAADGDLDAAGCEKEGGTYPSYPVAKGSAHTATFFRVGAVFGC